MASLRERKRRDGTTAWAVLYSLDGRQTSATFDDEKTAQRFADAVDSIGARRAMESWGITDTKRAITGPAGVTVRDYIDRHLTNLSGVEKRTIDYYRGYAKRDINPHFGDLLLTELSHDEIAQWVMLMHASGSAPKTIKNKKDFLGGVLKTAVKRGLIGSNPCEGVKIPRGEQDDPVFLSHDQFDTLLDAVTEPWRPLVNFLAMSGCRWGEAAALKPTDVDRLASVVKIRRAWKYSKGGYYLGPPKTKRSRRTINVDAAALEQLDYTGEWLFTNPGRGRNNVGGPVRYPNFYANVWKPAVDRAELDPRPTVHDLRHTNASWLLQQGTSIFVVSRHLGHESIKTTGDIYGHLDQSSSAEAAAMLGRRRAKRH